MQLRGPGLRQRDARSLEELVGLALGETEVCRADLGQLAGETKLVQPEGQITPRCEDRVHMLGELLQQPGQLHQRFRRGQLVQVINDQEGAIAMLGQFRQNSLADGRFVEVGCRGQLLAFAGRARGVPDGAEDGKPELLGVLLVALHLQDCQPVRLTWPTCPGPEQRSLAAACGGRDKRYLRCRRAIQGREKFSALNQPLGCRTRLSRICPKYHAGTRSAARWHAAVRLSAFSQVTCPGNALPVRMRVSCAGVTRSRRCGLTCRRRTMAAWTLHRPAT